MRSHVFPHFPFRCRFAMNRQLSTECTIEPATVTSQVNVFPSLHGRVPDLHRWFYSATV